MEGAGVVLLLRPLHPPHPRGRWGHGQELKHRRTLGTLIRQGSWDSHTHRQQGLRGHSTPPPRLPEYRVSWGCSFWCHLPRRGAGTGLASPREPAPACRAYGGPLGGSGRLLAAAVGFARIVKLICSLASQEGTQAREEV